jgi:metal-dependent hydrolase (beta-lactamase superfamily II)
MNTTPHYEYSDGNSNLYILTSTELKYIPVKPENSSSGVYDGGEAKTVTVTSNQFTELQTLLEKVLNQSSIHIENRVMMSGQIKRVDSNSKKQCIIKPGSPEIAQIEQALKNILR